MRRRGSLEELRQELTSLMEQHLESLKRQTFLPDQKQRQEDEERLKRIREVSADYLAVFHNAHTQKGGSTMAEKPSVKLPAKVEKVIEGGANEPEKAEISIEGADPLYREIRIENSLTDADGHEVRLEENDEVDVTVEADKDSTTGNSPATPLRGLARVREQVHLEKRDSFRPSQNWAIRLAGPVIENQGVANLLDRITVL